MTSPEADARHLLGLLLGTEGDWPRAFEDIVGRLGPVTGSGGRTHHYQTERVTIEPFDLRAKPRYDLVIDRLAYWYHVPREWLKKVAMMDDVYLLNSPFTFQAMEKHAAYCAMIRLGLKVPTTWLVPYKQPVEHAKYTYTAARYNKPFDLEQIAEQVGYPMFMKPYDGGAWRGVSQVRNPAELHRAYDESGEMLMHLQAAVDGFDVFARSLSIGAETMVMRFQPEKPMHDRYAVDHAFLASDTGLEVRTIGRIVNAFFRWEFNSCETLVLDDEVYPIAYANACPDVALTSLHYYFPWAIRSLVKWSVFCTATGRAPQPFVDPAPWFDIAARSDLSYGDKLGLYAKLADEYFDTGRYEEFCAGPLRYLDEIVLDYVCSPGFDDLLVDTVKSTFPAPEHAQYVPHFRGLLGAWAADEGARLDRVGA